MPEKTTTVFRVQGGSDPTKRSKELIKIDSNGNVKINKKTLNISLGDVEHATYYKTIRPDSYISSFEVP